MANATCNPTTIRQRTYSMQARWTPSERQRRAEEGRRRRHELFSLIADADADSEIWAVGATAAEDCSRFLNH